MALTGQHFNFHRLLLGQHIGSSKPPVLPRGVNSRLALGGHFYSGGDIYPALDDPILEQVVATARHLDSIQRFDVPAEQRGIALFQAARKALHAAEAQGLSGYFHQPKPDLEPEEMLGDDGEDFEIPEDAYD
ncbi:hypothetical protein [Pseudomonas cerasi]|uniref:hypothetical protein n=1 Tax=Pseudomonas cerasi TaxID=1583341 RepID=UPI0018D4DC1B|nr:hypothetical protein [Pseudomonas cerasi]